MLHSGLEFLDWQSWLFWWLAASREAIIVGILFVTFISWIPGHGATYLGSTSNLSGDCSLSSESTRMTKWCFGDGRTGVGYDSWPWCNDFSTEIEYIRWLTSLVKIHLFVDFSLKMNQITGRSPVWASRRYDQIVYSQLTQLTAMSPAASELKSRMSPLRTISRIFYWDLCFFLVRSDTYTVTLMVVPI